MYGLNILNVVEIIRMIKITPIPESLAFIKGVVNLRGKVIPVMDIRLRFGMEEKEYGDRTCIIVVDLEGVEMGIIVDSVSEVEEIQENQIDKMPSVGAGDKQHFIKGLGKTKESVKILLDLEKLLSMKEIEHIAAVK